MKTIKTHVVQIKVEMDVFKLQGIADNDCEIKLN